MPNPEGRSIVVERLKRRGDFRAAASGMRASGRTFVLQARLRADEGAVRVGFTVARQVGHAVERNQVRRRLREIIRLSAAAGAGLRPGHDYVLVGRRAALTAPFGEMMRDFDAALAKVHAQIQASERGRIGGGTRPEPLHEPGSQSRRPQPRRADQKPPEKSTNTRTELPSQER